jgi:hypothetical protein
MSQPPEAGAQSWHASGVLAVEVADCAAPVAGEAAKPCNDTGQRESLGPPLLLVAVIIVFAIVLWLVVMRRPHRAT